MRPEELPQHIPEIVTAWCVKLRESAAECPRRDERGRAERALVSALVRVGLAPQRDEAALHTVVIAAANYGRLQHWLRIDPDEVLREFSLLRMEIWRRLARDSAGDEWALANQFILKVDTAISAATRSALRGAHGHGQATS